jgi:hypothetical protein
MYSMTTMFLIVEKFIVEINYMAVCSVQGEYSDTSIIPFDISKERIKKELHQIYLSPITLNTVAFIKR